MLLTNQFNEASDVINQIEQHGYQAYFVGGCVRDLLLGHQIGDIDIATSATPDIVQQIFTKVIPVGLKHGTVIVRHNQQSYEVTTFRVDDEYSDQRHPDSVQFVQTIDQDLKRRDFTINALAMDKHGNILDLFNGQDDLESGIIRTVGIGYERFIEDPLRILRALRFSSQLGFSLDPSTFKAMASVLSDIRTIAVERITEETAKFFSGTYINTGMSYFKQINIANYLPILQEHPQLIEQLPEEMKPLQSFSSVIALLHFHEPKITIHEWAREWKCSNKIKHEAESLNKALLNYRCNGLNRWLVYCLDDVCYSEFNKLVNMLFGDVISNETMKQMNDSLPIHSKTDLAISGTDLRKWYPDRPAGPWIGDTLNHIEMQVVLGNLDNDKYAMKEWIKWNPLDIG